ncbi:MAG: hypothetical protein KGH72_03350 [Candidatus Micrarchaeota archaeon]|nr:hypothetical protein [Candidatus Micrarchaeota archaeon]
MVEGRQSRKVVRLADGLEERALAAAERSEHMNAAYLLFGAAQRVEHEGNRRIAGTLYLDAARLSLMEEDIEATTACLQLAHENNPDLADAVKELIRDAQAIAKGVDIYKAHRTAILGTEAFRGDSHEEETPMGDVIGFEAEKERRRKGGARIGP